ncbi:M14 family metallocarboxypeptidase [Paenibacillus sp. 1P07SE]|uniref:M14 family metallopeptidase n=1 Tax=Paenibacillus sp. 1P07SE TaxID=3132209 RepID=UPI0039A5AE93
MNRRLTRPASRLLAHSGCRIVTAQQGYGPDSCEADMAALAAAYPFLHTEQAGSSVMGRPIRAVRFGEGDCRIHLNAAFHANEWITSLLAMALLEDLSSTYAGGQPWGGMEIRRIYEQYSLWILPMVNPDGVGLVVDGLPEERGLRQQLLAWNGGSDDFGQWKANIRGVDLNDQFPAYWEAECERRAAAGPGPRDYPGPQPLSEPEAAGLAGWTRRHDFDLVLALHTQGQEIYWNYRDYEPPEAEALAQGMARASGYKAVKLTDSDAGYKDWFIYEFRRPGFTIEAGYGVNPLPLTQLEDMYAELKSLLLQLLGELR